MVYAQIKDGFVKNIIVLNDDGLVAEFSRNFDSLVRIDGVTPKPSIGWRYDGANFSETSVPKDAYGNVVNFSTDGINDSYFANGNSFKFPAGTNQALAYLSIAKQTNLLLFTAAVQAFIESKYSINVRFNFIALYTNAQQTGLTDRLTYIGQLFSWSNSVIQYCVSYQTTIMALSNAATIAATTWDFAALDASDPHVSALGALAILT